MCTTFSQHTISEFSYSLRVFARDLELSASRLSEIVGRKHEVSEKTADIISEKLKLKIRDRQFLENIEHLDKDEMYSMSLQPCPVRKRRKKEQ